MPRIYRYLAYDVALKCQYLDITRCPLCHLRGGDDVDVCCAYCIKYETCNLVCEKFCIPSEP